MNDETLDRFLSSIPRKISDTLAGASRSAPSPEVLQETVEELQVAVEELRVSHDELLRTQLELEEARRATEELQIDFEQVFDTAPDALLVTDESAVVRGANAAAAALLGVRAPLLAGKPLAVYVADDARRGFRLALAAFQRELGARTLPLRLKPRGGAEIEAQAVVVPLSRRGRRSLLWTLRPAADDARAPGSREETEMMRGLLRSLPAAVAAMDLDGTVLAWNPAAERLLGWTEDEVAGRANPALPDEARARVAEARDAGDGRVSWLRAPAAHRDGGTVEVEVVLAPLAGADGEPRGTVAVIAESAAEADAEPGAASPAARRDDDETRGRAALPPDRVLAETGSDFLERLRGGIAAGLHLGRILPGDRLPSIRDAARSARTDHRVVSAAYRQLAGEGVVRVVNRRGVTVAPLPGVEACALSESAEWLTRVLADAWALRVKVPQIPDLVRGWTAGGKVRCACVESTDDDLAALTGELQAQWGLATFPVRVDDGAPDAPARRAALAGAMRGAELAVTTAFHARAVAPVAQAMGIPLVVASMSDEVVDAIEEKLRSGPLTAVVADERWGARLRAAMGGARLRVVRADDAAAVAALDPAEPVLLTRAARERIGAARPRLLVPPTHFLSTACAAEIARVLIRRNMELARALN